ncbi:tetratricopeptide repeat protein [Thermodesulfobacteriota bacterium]
MARRIIKEKPGAGKKRVLVILLIVLVALFGGYWFYTCLYPKTLEFNYIVLTRDGTPFKIINGETVRLNPNSRLQIKKISTNIYFNLGVRIVSTDIDINSLLYEEMLLSELLPDKDIFNRYSFPVEVKRYSEDMGHFEMTIEPYVEDWIDKAKRSIKSDKKIALLVKALDLGYEDRQIESMLADEYVVVKEWKKASLLLEKIVKESGDEGSIFKLLEVYEAMGDKGKIISTFNSLIDLNPDDYSLRLNFAHALEKAGKTKEAIKEYIKIVDKIPADGRGPVYKSLGYLYSENRQPKQAIDSYLKALKTDKTDVNLYYNISALYELTGDMKSADSYLGKAVELKADDVESRLKLSESLIKRKQYKRAETYLNQILKKNPNSVEAWYLISSMEEKRGDKKALKSAYKKILSIAPGSKTVIFNLGVLEHESGNYNNAVEYFNRYLKSTPSDIDSREFLFDIYTKQKKEKLAYAQALEILNSRPNKTEYYLYIFEYLSGIKDYKSMRNVMKTGLRNRPNDIEIKKYLIVACLKTGNEKEALSLINGILKTKPDDVSTLMQLARLYEKLGRLNDALENYKKVISLSPENEEAQESYLRLRIEVLK